MNAKTVNERQQKRREQLRVNNMKSLYVRGVNGEYDERIRVALAVKSLADKGLLSAQTIELIIDESIEIMPPKDKINRSFIKKLIANYLRKENDDE